MIADKIIPCFYTIDLSGERLDECLRKLGGDFGISSMILSSHNFKTDLQATAAMQDAIDSIANFVDLEDNLVEKTLFNPEFFPSLEPVDETYEQKLEREEAEIAADEASEELEKENKIAVTVSRSFDKMGDYVESRWEIEGKNVAISARVVTEVNEYLQNKALDSFFKRESMLVFKTPEQIHIH